MRGGEPDLLFSFVGGRTHPCRDAVLRLPPTRAVLEDSSGFDYLDRSAESDAPRERFDHVVSRSKFVLCPRGHGTSSFRMQEVLAAGRVPVVISDDWVEPLGPNWATAIVRWPERRVAELPGHLNEIEHRFPAMSIAAAALHDSWFGTGVAFDRMVEQLRQLPRSRSFPKLGFHDRWFWRLALARAKGKLSRGDAPGASRTG
jgi:hypothetical protein